jgi:hypothetical protein
LSGVRLVELRVGLLLSRYVDVAAVGKRRAYTSAYMGEMQCMRAEPKKNSDKGTEYARLLEVGKEKELGIGLWGLEVRDGVGSD